MSPTPTCSLDTAHAPYLKARTDMFRGRQTTGLKQRLQTQHTHAVRLNSSVAAAAAPAPELEA